MEFEAGNTWTATLAEPPEDPGGSAGCGGGGVGGALGCLAQPGAEGQQLCPQSGDGKTCPGQAAKTCSVCRDSGQKKNEHHL